MTGALLVFGEAFVQALEGEETIVRDLYATIEKDYRHDGVALVEAGAVPERVFAKWSMARVSETAGPTSP